MSLDERLESLGVVKRGHFLLSSGRHSDIYFEKFRILEHPEVLAEMVALILKSLDRDSIDLVIGPTTGGVIVAYEAARQLGKSALYAEREAGARALRRDAEMHPGSRVLVVDDLLTTGLSAQEVIDLTRQHGGQAVGLGVLIDRSNGQHGIDIPIHSALDLPAVSFEPQDCPLCRNGVPITVRGTRYAEVAP
ncbi:MAG: orotate phosphoribosyltransferase [Armatimonadetes bacterium]|nr:orotate phosphoribosyltransferase [Armatimonadota bacterium]